MIADIVDSTSDDVPGEILCLAAIHPEVKIDEILAQAASADPDTMYLHEALKEPDRAQFIKAMHSEMKGQVDNGNYSLITRSQVPEGASVLPAVWAMKRKRRIKTREVYKWKGRLNIEGSKQVLGCDYEETYAPVTSWPSVHLL